MERLRHLVLLFVQLYNLDTLLAGDIDAGIPGIPEWCGRRRPQTMGITLTRFNPKSKLAVLSVKAHCWVSQNLTAPYSHAPKKSGNMALNSCEFGNLVHARSASGSCSMLATRLGIC